MKLDEFDSHASYVAAQARTLRRRGRGPYFTWLEVELASDWAKNHWGDGRSAVGVCHGARNGLEADEFVRNFPDGSFFGTDLFPFSGQSAKYRGKSDVVEHDFSVQVPDWVGRFDIVYSNSLDHARAPVDVLKTWLLQLKPDGLLMLQWTSRSWTNTKLGDCFACPLDELQSMVSGLGVLHTTVHVDCSNVTAHKGPARRALVCDLLIVGKYQS